VIEVGRTGEGNPLEFEAVVPEEQGEGVSMTGETS
jgi:hypothetical protein